MSNIKLTKICTKRNVYHKKQQNLFQPAFFMDGPLPPAAKAYFFRLDLRTSPDREKKLGEEEEDEQDDDKDAVSEARIAWSKTSLRFFWVSAEHST